MAVYMVGTAGNSVAFLALRVFRVCSSSKRGNRIISVPDATAKFITAVIANTWKRGSTPTIFSSPGLRPGNHESICEMLADRLACVSIAPLDRPVVPPVYCSTAMSCSISISTSSGCPSLLIRSSNRMVVSSSVTAAISLRLTIPNKRPFSGGRMGDIRQTTICCKLSVWLSIAATLG